MSDPTESYTKIVDAAEKQAEGIFGRAEALFPTHSRDAVKLTREEQRRDYRMALQASLVDRDAPDGLRGRLRGGRQQFGLKRAAFDFIKWDRENRD